MSGIKSPFGNKKEEQPKKEVSKEAVDPKMKELESQVSNLQKQLEALSKNKQNNGGVAELARVLQEMQGPRIGDDQVANMLIDEASIDPDDYLDKLEAEVFFAPFAWYVITDDKRQGRPVSTPYGNAIEFEYAGEQVIKTGNTKTFNVYSQYVCQSKKEAEWLRNHRHFGLLFFVDMNKAINLDHRAMQAMVRHYKQVDVMDQQTVISYMKQYDELKDMITSDLDSNKKALAFYLGMRDREKIAKELQESGMKIYNENPLSEEELAGLKSKVS